MADPSIGPTLMHFDRTAFGDQFLTVVAAALPLVGGCFYRVEDGRHVVDHRLSGLSPYWLNRYYHRFWRFDPLHPERVDQAGIRLRSVTRETARRDAGAPEYFEQFLVPQNTVHQTELYFHAGSRIVAGASLLRSERNGPFTSDNLTFLDRLVGFVEDSVLTDEDETSGLDIPGLTPREREIANLVGAAMCNKDICRRLDIELPTVKTHISRILVKAGVRNRAELMKKLHGRG